ncbi:MAG: tetratricopeptide repeat protein [Asticcacaulis sp.]|nr:tetratricopeptide repeat protein [Asticcacaulis sp.]
MLKKVLSYTVAGLALVTATSAWAGDKLDFAPPDTWVKPVALNEAAKADAGAPIALLNMDSQVRFGPDGDSTYTEIVMRVQTPQGLPIARPYVNWNPETDAVTVHKVHIIRGSQVIDVLAGGQTFTVLRREDNLDRSMLDGYLTGVLQPEGLQVGDVLDYAVTVHHNDPVMAGNSESLLVGRPQVPVGRLTYRAVWPKTKAMRWHVSDDLTAAKLTKTADGSELTLDLKDYKSPEIPERVPVRLARTGELAFSQFASWRDLSALMGPLYAKAATLAPDSPLKAEVAKIKAASRDPKLQAEAALHLVEDQVRYVYIGANQGNYRPVDADVTWTRRFGDCKGKSALLLALLRELGIEADAVSVSTWGGDGLDKGLPMVELFDHVIVRAVIAGKVYWLDGTRLGDGSLDSLTPPAYQWALPMRPGGADLMAIDVPLPVQPLEETILKFDASAGLDVPAPAHVELVARGDAAIEMHNNLSAMAPDDLDKALKEYWSKAYTWITVETVDSKFDPATGELRMIMDGKAKMDWSSPGNGRPRQYAADGDFLGGGFGLTRKPGPLADAPVTLTYPRSEKTVETIILPHGGKGFSIAGETVDKTLAGYVMKRELSLKNGVFTMEVSQHTVGREIPLAEANAAEPELTRMGQANVHVQAPYDYAATDDDAKSAGTAEPKTADDYIARGGALMAGGQFDKAIADFDAALKLDPKSAKAMALRGNARAGKTDYDGALADYDAAVALDRRNVPAWYGRVYTWYRQKDYGKAIEAVTRLLDINPADTQARRMRGQLYLEHGDKDLALDDALGAQVLEPDSVDTARFLAQVYGANGKRDEQLQTLRAAVAKTPDNADLHEELARALLYCGHGSTAKSCEASEAEADAKFADLDQALKLQPDGPAILLTRANLLIYYKDYDKAAADPDNVGALLAHSALMEARGDFAAAIRDDDAIVAKVPDDAQYLNNACWTRAIHRLELDKALATCDASLKIRPNSGATLDSRGMVHLQLGQWETALADYDAALKAEGDFASALYGRGIAELRLGRKKEGRADLEAARKQYPDIGKTYAGYGIAP